MTDKKGKKAKSDELDALKDQYEVDYMKIVFGIPKNVTEKIVKKVGHRRRKVMKALKKEELIK